MRTIVKAVAAVAALFMGGAALGQSPTLADRLDVTELTVQQIAAPAPGQPGLMQVVLGGQVVDLVLTPVSVRSANMTLREDAGGGALQNVALPPEASFRGWCVDAPGVRAAVNVVNGGVRAIIDLGAEGPMWYVQPVAEAGVGLGGNGQYAVFSADRLKPLPYSCAGALEASGDETLGAAGSMPKGTGFCQRQTEIAFDADFLIYQANGSNTANVQADIDSIVNGMNLIYARDVQVNFVTVTTIVRTAAGLYNTTNINTLLTQMQTEWNTNQTGVSRDLAHLMTGQNTGTTVGLAFSDRVCSATAGYGVSHTNFSANLANRVSLTCHEVGHNFSASHCDGDADCAIMCSVINQCAHDVSHFSLRSINEMRPKAQSSYACLTGAAGWGAALPPHAMPDAASVPQTASVDIDVLANDFDGNCTAVTAVASNPAGTANAGTITKLAGAGPGGRDLLRYTAGASFAGTDTFTYTVSDGAGSTSATVSVTVTPPRAPDYAGGTQAQLSAGYYRLNGASSIPDVTGLFANFNGGGTNSPINFTSTTSPFIGGGPSDNYAAVFTITLNVATAGAYTLFTQSDEGSMLYVDNVLVVSNDFLHTSLEHSGNVTLTAGNHTLRLEYFDATGAGELILKWQGPGIAKQVIPGGPRLPSYSFSMYTLPTAAAALPNFDALTAYATATTPDINFASTTGNFAGSNRPDDVGARFTGLLSVPTSGVYTFFTESDDGSRLYINGLPVVNNNGQHAMTEAGAQIGLLAGLHTFRVDYYSAGGADGLIARWQGPGIAKAVIPAANLKRPGACGQADVGRQGGTTGSDGLLDNNDFVVFINLFFTLDPIADMGKQGGIAGSDGLWDNNDFVVFINLFFTPCS